MVDCRGGGEGVLAILRYPLPTAGRHKCTASTTATACCSATTAVPSHVCLFVALLSVDGVSSAFLPITGELNMFNTFVVFLGSGQAATAPSGTMECGIGGSSSVERISHEFMFHLLYAVERA